MKLTEARIRQNVAAANANSKHLGLGLRMERKPKGYELSIVVRINGFVMTTWEELSAGECQAAVSMFNHIAAELVGRYQDKRSLV